MNQTITIIQDWNTLLVLDVVEWKNSELKELKKNTFLPKYKNFPDNSFKIKDIRFSEENKYCLILVKCSKFTKEIIPKTVFDLENVSTYNGLKKFENKIDLILQENKTKTHVHSIAKKGEKKIAKKFGEEAVELVIESGKDNDSNFLDEAADVLYYYLILLHERGFNLGDILEEFKKQKRKN